MLWLPAYLLAAGAEAAGAEADAPADAAAAFCDAWSLSWLVRQASMQPGPKLLQRWPQEPMLWC
jgi:hypothetical protein